MEITTSMPLPVQLPNSQPKVGSRPTAAPTTALVEDEDRGSKHARRLASGGTQPGRRFVQQGAHHLLRDIRHQMKDEIAELRETDDQEKIDAVKSAYQDFRTEVKTVVESAGRGNGFDRGLVAEGLGNAMAAFTTALRELNGTAEDTAVIPEPVIPDPGGTKLPVVPEAPTVAEGLPTGALLDMSV